MLENKIVNRVHHKIYLVVKKKKKKDQFMSMGIVKFTTYNVTGRQN